MARVPLAWRNLTHDPVRFALFALGITFAVVLVFVQLGFRNALLDSNTQLHDRLRCDLVMVSPNRQAMAMREPIPRRRLEQARAVPGVAEVHPLYLENGIGFLRDASPDPADRKPSRGVRIIGVDPNAHLLDLPELDPADPRFVGDRLRTRDAALVDTRAKHDPDRPGQTIYGPVGEGVETDLIAQLPGDRLATRVRFVGRFTLGTDFTADGTVIVGEDTFLDVLRRPLTSGSPAADVDLGLIRLDRGADAAAVKAAVRAAVATGEPDADVDVFTLAELKEREKTFWLNNTPIGFAFGFGMFMGFAVGLVICYQILSGDVTDHLPEYATLKAMGHTNRYLAWVVLQEALILAAIGFVVGLGVSWAIYELLTATTGLPMRMTPDRALGVLATTLGMCCTSAVAALVGLLRADPADVF